MCVSCTIYINRRGGRAKTDLRQGLRVGPRGSYSNFIQMNAAPLSARAPFPRRPRGPTPPYRRPSPGPPRQVRIRPRARHTACHDVIFACRIRVSYTRRTRRIRVLTFSRKRTRARRNDPRATLGPDVTCARPENSRPENPRAPWSFVAGAAVVVFSAFASRPFVSTDCPSPPPIRKSSCLPARGRYPRGGGVTNKTLSFFFCFYFQG